MHIIKWAKRNVFSRSLHKKVDEKAIAAWKLDLDKIRHDLDVRPFTFVWRNYY